jgi:hypothetical protein
METKKIEMLFLKKKLLYLTNQSTFNVRKTQNASMSKNIANTNKSCKPFCKVCQDAGKPESVFTSHFVRSTTQPGSVVTCPTLLAMECRFCHKPGHTVKYCTILEERKKMDKKRENQIARNNKPALLAEPKKTQQESNNKNNIYSFLDSNDDSDSESEKAIINVPLSSASQVTETLKPTYAGILNLPRPEVQKLEPAVAVQKLEPAAAQSKPEPVPFKSFRKFPMKSWADWSDSEDEEDLVPPPKPELVRQTNQYQTVITKPELRRQPSLYCYEDEDDEYMPLAQPKLVRQYAYEGSSYSLNDSDDE